MSESNEQFAVPLHLVDDHALLSHPPDSLVARSLVISVEEAGKYFGLGRSASYEAVRRGELPVVRFGSRMVVPVRRLEAMLGGPPSPVKEQP